MNIEKYMEKLPETGEKRINGIKFHVEPFKPVCFQEMDASEHSAIIKSKQILEDGKWDNFIYLRKGEYSNHPYGTSIFYRRWKIWR